MREIGVAVFKARLICHSEFNDQDIDDDLLITDAWLRDAEGWRAVTRHASPVPKWKFVALQTQQLTRFAQVSRDTLLNTKSRMVHPFVGGCGFLQSCYAACLPLSCSTRFDRR